MDEKAAWEDILQRMIALEASDLHAGPYQHVQMRLEGVLVSEAMVPTPSFLESLVQSIISKEAWESLCKHDVDFAWSYQERRFRGNVYRMQEGLGIALRLLPQHIPTPEELGMPEALQTIAAVRDGLALICGATGAGKTTTLAALIEVINQTRSAHIITLEAPIEYLFTPVRAFFSQREAGRDFSAFPDAVRSALREDPDILLIGEIRDRATMEAALMAATTGVLVLGTLHTRGAAQTALRVEGMFPPDVRDTVRAQFADVLIGIFAQRLLPRKGGGRVAIFEALSATTAVRNILRQGNYGQLASVMMSGAAQGMQTAEMAETALRARGLIG